VSRNNSHFSQDCESVLYRVRPKAVQLFQAKIVHGPI
jgi:hypothetical protein